MRRPTLALLLICGALLGASTPGLLAQSPGGSTLTRTEAEALTQRLWSERRRQLQKDCDAELKAKTVRRGSESMRFLAKRFGSAPPGGHALFISLHGGGGAPAALNDSQWRNQIRLYQPKEGWYVAPRAPGNTWNLWHEARIDPLLDRLIEDFVIARKVDPNRVNLMGYSAGGDGVYQLAPRMADRFAAASMMAGHPNDASPLGLRNLPFAIFVGAEDAAYDRNKVAKAWGQRLDELAKKDPKGYRHRTTLYPGLGHWMKRKDAVALPYMAKRVRNPWPKTVVWFQDDVVHERFYWLALPHGDAAKGQLIRGSVEGQTIRLEAEGVKTIILRLNDALIDLDRPVVVFRDGKKRFEGRVPRTRSAIATSLRQRSDPKSVAFALLSISE